ncbi:MAG: alternative ribosome rescue aminoacyl-tRNA hydrolase ArfB [Desulfuromonadales bacterium]|nr:alternative ribosome rescue aminoacyl-tRNA hydrolase ArfB [Desulfuromonadales bacterium]MDT8422901.1 alternative ribosome rescue aminoacyl-tRNA hydrolase ArfB [Desulfuromonadales bacterium]
MLEITPDLIIPESEITFKAVRAQGAGGQNVNKVSSAVVLFFDIHASSLPDIIKARLLALNDQRITRSGTIIIKAQPSRSQEMNKEDALDRLRSLILSVTVEQKKRRPTRPTNASKARKTDAKVKKGYIKALRGKVRED